MFGIDDAILVGVGGSLIGGMLNNSAASDRQDSANAFSAQQFATRYQTTVKDMAAAGLNPMLAYSGISGSAPTGSIASSAGYPDFGQVYNASRVASAQVANIEADTENKAAQANLWNAQASQAQASASQSNASVSLVQAQTDKVVAEIKNIPAEYDRLVAAAENLRRQSGLYFQQQVTESQRPAAVQADIRQTEAVTRKVLSETNLLDLDINAANRLENLGRTSKELKPVIDTILSIVRTSRSK